MEIQELRQARQLCIEDGNFSAAVIASHILSDMGCEDIISGLYSDDMWEKQDYNQTASVFITRADQEENIHSQNMLAHMYNNGLGGLDEDIDKAEKLYTEAATKGNYYSQANLGVICYEREDYVTAKTWLEKAASCGVVFAMSYLARIYYYGLGVPFNTPEAQRLFELAASKGGQVAYSPLSRIYFSKKDNKKGIQILESGVENGSSYCAATLGNFYKHGIIVRKDMKECIRLYEIAVQLEDVDSMYELGTIYYCGKDNVQKDKTRAIALLEAASKLGHVDATIYLGEIYLEDKDGFSDYQKGRELLERVWREGNKSSVPLLLEIYYDAMKNPALIGDMKRKEIANKFFELCEEYIKVYGSLDIMYAPKYEKMKLTRTGKYRILRWLR